MCEREAIRDVVCENIVFLLSGFDKKQLNEVSRETVQNNKNFNLDN